MNRCQRAYVLLGTIGLLLLIAMRFPRMEPVSPQPTPVASAEGATPDRPLQLRNDTEDRSAAQDCQLFLTTDDPEKVQNLALAAIQARGGSVIQMRLWTTAPDRQQAQITFQVPGAVYAEAMAELRTLGTVQSESSRSLDINAEFMALTTELEGLYATQAQLRLLLGEVADLDDALPIYDDMAAVILAIHHTEGQLAALNQQQAMATITLHISPREPTAPPAPTATPAASVTTPTQPTNRPVPAGEIVTNLVTYVANLWGPWLFLLVIFSLAMLMPQRHLNT